MPSRNEQLGQEESKWMRKKQKQKQSEELKQLEKQLRP